MSDNILTNNQAFFISVLAMLGGCLAGAAHCILKSRCTKIKVCGGECVRNPLPPNVDVNLDSV